MRIHILVEGPSDRALIDTLFPRLLGAHVANVIVHQGKGKLRPRANPRHRGLLDQLTAKLRAYGRALNPETDRVLVLVDADERDCRELKRQLKRVLARIDPQPTVLFRIAVEETEAFYLGDARAIRRAFPQANLARMQGYVQDSVCGSAELFQAVVGAPSEDKVTWAERMGPELSIRATGRLANRSPSFHQLRRGLRQLAGEADEG